MVKEFLNDAGRAYFVYSSLSNKEILNEYIKKNNLKGEIISNYKYNDEKIEVYLITDAKLYDP